MEFKLYGTQITQIAYDLLRFGLPIVQKSKVKDRMFYHTYQLPIKKSSKHKKPSV